MCSVVVSTGWCEMTAMLLFLSLSLPFSLPVIRTARWDSFLRLWAWIKCRKVKNKRMQEAVYILCKKKKRELRTGIDAGIELCNRFAPFWLKLCKEQHTLLQLFCLSLKYIYIYMCRSCPTMPSPREKCHAEHSGIGIVHNVLMGCRTAAGHVKPFHAVSKAVLKLEQTDHTNGQPMLISPPHWEL